MTVTVNFKQTATPGYEPRKPLTLHNVEAVFDKGPNQIELRFTFSDNRPTYDHVASVSVKPETED